MIDSGLLHEPELAVFFPPNVDFIAMALQNNSSQTTHICSWSGSFSIMVRVGYLKRFSLSSGFGSGMMDTYVSVAEA